MNTTALSPVGSGGRIWVMDALRGFAILGIFIANLGSGFSFYDPSGENTGAYFSAFDDEMTFLHHMLIEGKFYSIFSFLFGWGIALQLERSEAAGRRPLSFIIRRLVFMFLLGLAHIILLWPGDIVAFYALVAFLLLVVRNWSSRTLLVTSVILLLSPILLYYLKMRWPDIFMAPIGVVRQGGFITATALTGITSEESYMAYVRDMNYFDMVRLNAAGFFFRFSDLFFQSRISKVLGMFIVGYLIGRQMRFARILSRPRLLWIIAGAGLVVGLTANYIMSVIMESDPAAYYQLQPKGLYRTIAYAMGVAPLACAYISLFFLASRTAAGKRILGVLEPAGKMAFSNYIMQSVVGILAFQTFAFGMLGKVGPVFYTFFALIVFVLQVIISHIWLKFFEFGPVEWLWRSATYGKWQRFRRRNDGFQAPA